MQTTIHAPCQVPEPLPERTSVSNPSFVPGPSHGDRTERIQERVLCVAFGLANVRRGFLAVRVEPLECVTATVAGFTGCRAAITAAGFFAITVRKARAEDSGVRRPPSQCFTASRLKPNVSEKRDWVMFNRLRMALTSTSEGTL